MRYVFLASLILFTFIQVLGQTVEGFSYKNYPVKNVYKGVKAKLNFTGNPAAKNFRTRISEGYKHGKINFAGNYITIYWGCGTGCSSGVMVDARTGKIYALPDSEENNNNYCDNAIHGGKVNSRMYVTSGCEFNVENSVPTYFVFLWNEKTKKFIQVSK